MVRVAVIGAGASGLTSVKALLEEGHIPVGYEWTHHVGGLWRFRDEDQHGLASVMYSTIINSSKEMSSFSDFPPPTEAANYMHNSAMIAYLEAYAEKFDLVRYFKFGRKVIEVKPLPGQRWSVQAQDVDTGKIEEQEYDAVMVCTGHHVFPLEPDHFPGQSKFRGKILHTHSYKRPLGFENKSIVVVGVGNSGGDVAVELSQVAKKVYLSTRRGCWIIHRVGPNGRPFDAAFIKRSWNVLFQYVPYELVCAVSEYFINRRFDHAAYGLQPRHRIFGQHPMVNDALPNRILSGTVMVKGNIARFTENGVVFEGDEDGKETQADVVLLATGYRIHFPFLPDDILNRDPSKVALNEVEVYKYVVPPRYPTLSFIGLTQSVGALFPCAELQARWISRVLSGRTKLPSEDGMYRDVRFKREENAKRYFEGPRNTLQFDWLPYMDEIASLIDAKPNLSVILAKDPQLFWHCFTGPCLPYQYRLQGPHPWKGARGAILEYDNRVLGALKTRKLNMAVENSKTIPGSQLALVAFALAMILFFITIIM